jgi:hypothetical protein
MDEVATIKDTKTEAQTEPGIDWDKAFPEPDNRDVRTAGPYKMMTGSHFAYVGEKDTKILTNFTARILADVLVDDGDGVERHHEVEAQLGDRIERFIIAAAELNKLAWVAEKLGGGAIVETGAKNHVGNAIRWFSTPIPERRMIGHIGWFEADGAHVYLDSAGVVVGDKGAITANLPHALSRYRLPTVTSGDELRVAIRESLAVLEMGRPEVTVPLLGAVYRSVLGSSDFSVHLVGDSGTYKSSLAGIALSHFGAGFERTTLPASWASTVNALDGLAWHAKDALLVVDDYVPNEDNAAAKAAHLFRAQGNANGRSRLHGGSLSKATRHPRGLILSTGEAVPLGGSIRARLVIVPVAEDAITLHRLAAAQKRGKHGKHATAMAGFVAWLAERYEEVQESLISEIEKLRIQFEGPRQHTRAANNAAHLQLGIKWFLRFAQERHAIYSSTVASAEATAMETLKQLTRDQSQYQDGGDSEVEKFINLLRLVFHLRRGHLHHVNGWAPQRAGLWGWDHPPFTSAKRRGDHVGWIKGGDMNREVLETDLYLIPDVIYKLCQSVAPTAEQRLYAKPQKLWRMLDDAGLLASTEMTSRGTRTIRKQIKGRRHDVIHLYADLVAQFDHQA